MYLGLDLGTSGLKAMLIDGAQRLVGSTHAALGVSRPRAGWSEQAPDDWIGAAAAALDGLRARHPRALEAVTGIGLSGQMHGAALLDAADRPLRPAILWNDVRSADEAARLDADPRFRAISGNIVFPGFTAPKLLWTRANEPEVFARVAKVLLPKDYLRLWLTGEHVSDMSDAAGTGWLDTGAREWSGDLLAAGGVRPEQMPRLVEGTEVSGRLRPEIAARWGMKADAAVAGGAGDNAASAVGLGVVGAGAGFASLGTSGVLFAASDSYLPRPASAVHAFCHALPGRWHQMGVILSAASALDWFAGLVGERPDALLGALGEDVLAPSGVMFLPYLSGERTPHNDAVIRGGFHGLGHETGRAEMTRALLEGVAFALRDCLEALRAAGTELETIAAVGGGSRSALWLRIVATALGKPVTPPEEGDFGAAFGAARLGLVAATGADPLEVCRPPPAARAIEPVRAREAAFEDAYALYRARYASDPGRARPEDDPDETTKAP